MTVKVTESKLEAVVGDDGYNSVEISLGVGTSTNGSHGHLVIRYNADDEKYEIHDITNGEILTTNSDLSLLVDHAKGKYVDADRVEYV